MTQVDIKYLEDKDGNKVAPITHVNAVRDSNGDTLPEILDRDYPTTSKTPVENSSEVSLCTRGEKYEWNKVGNATDATGASDITSTFKYLLLNGTTGAFETALKSYVEESVRAALGSLLNNLDKGTGVKAVAGIDNNNDLGSVTLSNLASVLGGDIYQNITAITAFASLDNPPRGFSIDYSQYVDGNKGGYVYSMMTGNGSAGLQYFDSWDSDYILTRKKGANGWTSWKKIQAI